MFVHFITELTAQPGPGVGHAEEWDLAKAGAAAGCPAAPTAPPGEPAEEESVYTGALCLVPCTSLPTERGSLLLPFTPSGSLTKYLVVQDKPELDKEYDCWKSSNLAKSAEYNPRDEE